MKWKIILCAALCGSLTLSAAAQAPSPDKPQAQRELAVMAGILDTTVRYALNEQDAQQGVLRHTRSIRGHYLMNQGAVFSIAVPAVRLRDLTSSNPDYYRNWGVVQATVAPSAGKVKAEKQSLDELLEATRKREEARQEVADDYSQRLERIQDYLLDAIANHGDSLKFVKGSEYVNVVLYSETGDVYFLPTAETAAVFGATSSASFSRTISVQKSWIEDYRAGRLTLDAFKKKALVY